MNKTTTTITKDEIAYLLTEIIIPFCKSFPYMPDRKPHFRKSLTGQEVETLLGGIYDIIRTIRLEEHQ